MNTLPRIGALIDTHSGVAQVVRAYRYLTVEKAFVIHVEAETPTGAIVVIVTEESTP